MTVTMDRVTNAFTHDFSMNVLSEKSLRENGITPTVLGHLRNVYATLVLGIVAAAGGAYLDLLFRLGGFLSFIGALGLMFWMASTSGEPIANRMPKFLGFCTLQGMSLGQLVRVILIVDPSILVTAFAGTALVFACFSLATLFAKRRQMLYLGALLSSAIGWLMLLSLLNLFFRAEFLLNVQLYGGLVVFCLYVMYDTEMIVAKVTKGDNDFVWHAVELFIDFVAIFVRIALILLKNSGNKKDKRRR